MYHLCALRIDACDDVMNKIAKPRGLIGTIMAGVRRDGRALRVTAKKPSGATSCACAPSLLLLMWRLSVVGLGLCPVYPAAISSDVKARCATRPSGAIEAASATSYGMCAWRQQKLGEDRLIHLSLTSDKTLRIELQGRDDQLNVLVPAIRHSANVSTFLPDRKIRRDRAPTTDLRLLGFETSRAASAQP